MPKNLRATAAWRISIWTTLAFGLGTAVAFSIVYYLVAQGIRERSDTWLTGEAEVLAQVSADTPSDRLYKRVVGEVAELATQEVPDERNARGERLNSVFFLVTDPSNSESPLWVGPSSNEAFLKAIQQAKLVPGAPKSIAVEGWSQTFRVVVKDQKGKTVYLGLSDRGAKHVLHILARRFLMIWGGMFLLGFVDLLIGAPGVPCAAWNALRRPSRELIRKISGNVCRNLEIRMRFRDWRKRLIACWTAFRPR